MNNRPELLAPAGSPETFIAAIAAGADAVYLGGRRFGARHFASNFDDDNLAEAVRYAHLREIRVYITLNTLIHDDEIPDILQYLYHLCRIGVDAVLVQDIGILSLFREVLADLHNVPALHASTQMAIHNREGAWFASEQGCRRIVLARELPAAEVREIVISLKGKKTGVEIFAHGALCYAFSGQCLLSSVIGGRSGNRGMCAQPCRKPYELLTGKPDQYGRLTDPQVILLRDKYLLSTRDLALYQILENLPSLMVDALKIEGRMRSTQYVAIVTDIYRRALDAVFTGNFNQTEKEKTDLALAFSRGFTTGYLDNQSSHQVMGRDLPGNRGLLVGTVIRAEINGKITLKPEGRIIPERGDGLVCIGPHEDQGFVLYKDPLILKTEIICDSVPGCMKGDKVYLTSRDSMNRSVENLLKNPDTRFMGSIILDLVITISDEGIVHIVCTGLTRSGLSITHSFKSQHTFSPARSKPLSSSQIADAIRKTGGTRYNIRHLEIICPGGLFVPVSILNAIRREIFDQIDRSIIEQFQPSEEDLETIKIRIENIFPKKKSVDLDEQNPDKKMSVITVVGDTHSLEAAICAGADRAYLEWFPGGDRKNALMQLRNILLTCRDIPDYRDKTGIKLPKVLLRSEMELLYEVIPEIVASELCHILVDAHGLAQALTARDHRLIISGYSGLNITNHHTLISCSTFHFLTLSCELSGIEIKKTMMAYRASGNLKPVAIFCQGLIEAMITRDHLNELAGSDIPESCVIGIRDQKEIIFPVSIDPTGNTHIYNAFETSLIEKIPEMRIAGIDILIIDGRMRTPEYIHKMVEIYKNALSIPVSSWSPVTSGLMKKEVKKLSWGEPTAATWKRGLSRS